MREGGDWLWVGFGAGKAGGAALLGNHDHEMFDNFGNDSHPVVGNRLAEYVPRAVVPVSTFAGRAQRIFIESASILPGTA
jgi:hypothetical protein